MAYVGTAVQAIVFGFFLGDNNWDMLFAGITLVCAAMAILSVVAAKNTKKEVPVPEGEKASTRM